MREPHRALALTAIAPAARFRPAGAARKEKSSVMRETQARAPDPLPVPSADEDLLLERLAAGDRGAADDLAAMTYGPVYAALARLSGDPDLAADLTQETYRKAWRSLASFDRRSRFSTWLYRIAYNTFLNHVRRPQPLQSLDDDAPAPVKDPAPGAEERAARRESAARLRRAVLGLPEEVRFTVTARFWGDLEIKELAALENITGTAIRKRLKKAYAHLGTVLSEEAA